MPQHSGDGVPRAEVGETASDREDEPRLCVICGSPSTTTTTDRLEQPASRPDLPDPMPPLELCEEHWRAYQTDWLLLGWCDGHYGEALRFCDVHGRGIEPL